MISFIELLRSGKIKRILVTSHRDPDVDAIASSLLMYSILRENFPNIEVAISIETDLISKRLNFFHDLDKIRLVGLTEMIGGFSPDLVIITDAPVIKSLTNNKELTVDSIKAHGITLSVFDHHDTIGMGFDYYVNIKRLSCVEVIYYDFVLANKLKLPKGWQDLVLSGLLTDSDRFYFDSPKTDESLYLTAEITKDGYSIKELSEKLTGYSIEQFKILAKLLNNVVINKEKRYAYSFLTDEERNVLIIDKMSQYDFMDIRRFFIDKLLNFLDDTDFVFTLRKPIEFNGNYSGSIRAKKNTINCLVLLKYLDGGGYVDGGGFSVKSDTLEGAIEYVIGVVERHRDEAYIK
jgi:nanoRNase/pAp phosphatase (c-di-AMP/oligoRNAs hydrolase)